MSLVGLGCVKTPVLAAHVETSRSNSISESQTILHTRASMRRWRIVFSTFRGCMSFYTARVNRVRGRCRPLVDLCPQHFQKPTYFSGFSVNVVNLRVNRVNLIFHDVLLAALARLPPAKRRGDGRTRRVSERVGTKKEVGVSRVGAAVRSVRC
jgi:hypothetical protein